MPESQPENERTPKVRPCVKFAGYQCVATCCVAPHYLRGDDCSCGFAAGLGDACRCAPIGGVDHG